MAIIDNDGTKFGFKAENGSLTGALKTIQSRQSDIAFIGCFIKDYETRDVEFSAPIYSDELCVIDKPAGRIPQFLLPLIVFDRTLWMFLCLDTLVGKKNFESLNIFLFLKLFMLFRSFLLYSSSADEQQIENESRKQGQAQTIKWRVPANIRGLLHSFPECTSETFSASAK